MMPTFPCFARFSRSGVDASHPNKKTAGSTDGLSLIGVDALDFALAV
jgi:hypothetical protein